MQYHEENGAYRPKAIQTAQGLEINFNAIIIAICSRCSPKTYPTATTVLNKSRNKRFSFQVDFTSRMFFNTRAFFYWLLGIFYGFRTSPIPPRWLPSLVSRRRSREFGDLWRRLRNRRVSKKSILPLLSIHQLHLSDRLLDTPAGDLKSFI
jgi:hypothetical protein